MKIRTADGGKYIIFWCPGCDEPHQVPVAGEKAWGFNGDKESPTISPSLLVHGDQRGGARCHLFLKAGQLEFLSDSGHSLAGKTVPLPEWPYKPGDFGGIDQ